MDSLIFKSTLQAVTLSAISNTIAQLLSCYQEGVCIRTDTVQIDAEVVSLADLLD